MLGVEPRAGLLSALGESLLANPEFFGPEGRPGNLVGKSPKQQPRGIE
jgi:hypothetical protein